MTPPLSTPRQQAKRMTWTDDDAPVIVEKETLSLETFHLPGQHNQKRHGNRYKSGVPVSGPAKVAYDREQAKKSGGGGGDSGGGDGGSGGGGGGGSESVADDAASDNVPTGREATSAELAEARQIHDVALQRREQMIEDSLNMEPGAGAIRESHQRYTGSGYKLMNKLLRGEDPGRSGSPALNEKALTDIGHMDQAFDQYGLTTRTPMVVHRGLDKERFNTMSNAKSGSVFVDDGFMSTSTDRDQSLFFSEGPTLLQIHVPPGKRTLFGHPDEDELIFPRGTQFRTVGTTPNGDLMVEMI